MYSRESVGANIEPWGTPALKVASATFLLVCFVYLKESTL